MAVRAASPVGSLRGRGVGVGEDGDQVMVYDRFVTYWHPAIDKTLTAQSMKPKVGELFFAFVLLSFSFGFLMSPTNQKWNPLYIGDMATVRLQALGFSERLIGIAGQAVQVLGGLLLLASILNIYKLISLGFTSRAILSGAQSTPETFSSALTTHQRSLVGLSSPSAGSPQQEQYSSPMAHMQPSSLRYRNVHGEASPIPVLLAPVHNFGLESASRLSPSRWTGDRLRTGSLFLGGGGSGSSPLQGSSPPVASSSPGYPTSLSLPTAYGSSPPGGGMSSSPPLSKSPWKRGMSLTPQPRVNTESDLDGVLADIDKKMKESFSGLGGPVHTSSLGAMSNLKGGIILGGEHVSSPPGIGASWGVGDGSGISANIMVSDPMKLFSSSPASGKAWGASVQQPKGHGDLPPPMSMEAVDAAYRRLGVQRHIDMWRDRLRQWFSEKLLAPLIFKMENSHLQVTTAAAKLGISICLQPLGQSVNGTCNSGGGPLKPGGFHPLGSSPEDGGCHGGGWMMGNAFANEDIMLQLLLTRLTEERDKPIPAAPTMQPSPFGLQTQQQRQEQAQQQQLQQMIRPVIQECIDAVVEHQRLKMLLRGEWAPQLLPQNHIPAEYIAQRIKDLGEGTCVRHYNWKGGGEWVPVGSETKKGWTSDLPSDSHLLLYLFCALLEHPGWMLRVDPLSPVGTGGGSSPFYVVAVPQRGVLEKYVAILPTAPGGRPPEKAIILSVSKDVPPIFALYWEGRAQSSLQGRTALWDAIVLLLYEVQNLHGGVVRGVSLNSQSLDLSSVIEPTSPTNYLLW